MQHLLQVLRRIADTLRGSGGVRAVQEGRTTDSATRRPVVANAVQRAEPEGIPVQEARVATFDLSPEGLDALKILGFSASDGTFGTAYKVPRSGGYHYVEYETAKLPHAFGEADIVVLNIEPDPPFVTQSQRLEPPENARAPFRSAEFDGHIDARPITMKFAASKVAKLLSHDGIVVVLAGFVPTNGYQFGRAAFGELSHREPVALAAWPFLEQVHGLRIGVDGTRGERVVPCEVAQPRHRAVVQELQRLIPAAEIEYACTFDVGPTFHYNGAVPEPLAEVTPLMRNTRGDVVSFAAELRDGGVILALPRVRQLGPFLSRLFSVVLPLIRPRLFRSPSPWNLQAQYWPLEISLVLQEAALVRQKMEEQLAEFQQREEQIREQYRYLNDLLTESGDALVDAVAETLRRDFGFVDVVDVDNSEPEFVAANGLREDLWIRDRSPTILVEVKGLSGGPKESDALQVAKHLFPRAQQWASTKLTGLFIVNHERGIAPVSRRSDPFQAAVVQAARDQSVCLLTTWEIFQLASERQRWSWPPEWLQDILFVPGRPALLPSGYRPVGIVEEVYARRMALSIVGLEQRLKLGDVLAVARQGRFVEWGLESIQIEGEPVEDVEPPAIPGINYGCDYDPKVGDRLFLRTGG